MSQPNTLKALLQDNPTYSDTLAEQVLPHYLRVHNGYVRFLVWKLGMSPEDVEQETRIALWHHWTRYQQGSNVSLQQWLSWRIRHHFKSLVRKHLRKACKLPTLSLEAILEGVEPEE